MRIPEWIVLLIFCCLLVCVIPKHESWFDEAQAWLIVRDANVPDLLLHRLHYEGSPGLWHLLLWVEWRLHISLLGMHFVAGAIAAAGIAVWLRFSPLPRVISLLIPFGFFFQYQYAVIARSYVLCALLAFILMALYSKKESSLFSFCIVAGLLANCSLHMAALSTGLVFLYMRDRRCLRINAEHREQQKVYAAYGILALLYLFAAVTALPTADGSSTTANPIVSSIRRVVNSSHEAPITTSNPIGGNIVHQASPPQQNIIGLFLWRMINTPSAASRRQILLAACAKHLVVLLTALTAPISTSNIFSITFLSLFVVTALRSGNILLLVPYVLVQLCNVLISGEAHHLGLLWIALLCSLWAMLVRPESGRDDAVSWRRWLLAATGVVAIWQITWTWHAIRSDIAYPYSSSKAAAEFLAHLPEGTRVAAFDDDSVTVNAYLAHRPYFNQELDYWPFSKTRDADLFIASTMERHPDIVMLKMASPLSPVTDQWVKLVPEGTEITQPVLEIVRAYGYQETDRFCGQRYFRNSAESTDCRLVYRPAYSKDSSVAVVHSSK